MTISIERRDTTVFLAEICSDYPAQLRAGMDRQAIDEYAKAMENGEEFPMPLLVDGPEGLIPVDGHHRIEAMRQIGRESFEGQVATVPQGVDATDYARLLSIRFNNRHGVRKTRSDKHKERATVVPLLLQAGLSNRQIATELSCDEGTIRNIRKELGLVGGTQRDAGLAALFNDFVITTDQDIAEIEEQQAPPEVGGGQGEATMAIPRNVSKEIQLRVRLNKDRLGISEAQAINLFMAAAAVLSRMQPADACACSNALYVLQARAAA